jgi:hypothetical protein
MPAMHHLAWAPIFHCMQESDMEIRKQALEDVNTLLHDNFKNAKSIVRTNNWQAWVYLLLCDVPRHNQTSTIVVASQRVHTAQTHRFTDVLTELLVPCALCSVLIRYT